MDNNNNNQILDVEGWPNDVYGFLRGTRSSGLKLWVTFLLEDKVGLNDTNNKKQRGFPDIGEEEQNEDGDKEEWVNEEEEDYNPYIRLYIYMPTVKIGGMVTVCQRPGDNKLS